MIYYERGDIIETYLEHIIHGCNNRGKYAKGVALSIATAFPEAQKEYFDLLRNLNWTEREDVLGQVQIVLTKGKVIGNLFTQGSYGKTGVHAELQYIYSSISNFINITRSHTIASPKVGTGYGGLEWEKVKQVYERICSEHPQVSFLVYDIGRGMA